MNNINDLMDLAHWPHWLKTHCEKAAEIFVKQGFPTSKNEDWRYTSLRTLLAHDWKKSDISLNLVGATGGRPDDNLIITDFISALKHHPAEMEKYFPLFFNNAHQDSLNTFYAFNTALFHQGFVIIVPENMHLEEPIEIIYPNLSTEHMACWRNLIILKKNAQATVIESFGENPPCTPLCKGGNKSATFHQAITEVYLDSHAQLQHYKKQTESDENFHLSELFVKQQDHSHLESHVLSLKGGFIRSDTHVRLEAPHASCVLNGISLGQKKQAIDHHTTVEHLMPNGTSNEYYKGILNDNAQGTFNGKVIVSPKAIQTDAAQQNKTLLLSRAAQINSKPQLEIFSDDVKCTHGSTVGQLDEDALFYLQTRGIEQSMAQQLLMEAFLSDLLERIPNEAIKNEVQMCTHSLITHA